MKIVNLGSTIYANYLIVTKGGDILIDCGNNVAYSEFLKRLDRCGEKKEDIKAVVLTHVHADHVSYLADLLKDINPALYVGAGAKEYLLKGRDNHVAYSSNFNRLLSRFTMKLRGGPAGWDPVDIGCFNTVVVDKEQPLQGFDATLIPLPGHTLDSIGLLIEEKFFVGDAVMACVPAKHLIPLLIEDGNAFKTSYDKLTATNAKTYYPGHGSPITVDALTKNRPFAENVELV